MPLYDLEVAFAALTRFPSRLRAPPRPHEIEAAMQWFPLAGAAVGLAASCLYFAASALGLPGLCALLVALTGQLLASGAQHEVGVARTIETLAETRSPSPPAREQRGVYFATLALALLVLARVAALLSFWSPWSFAAAAIAAAAFSRALIPLVLVSLPSPTSLRPERARALLGLGLALAIALVLLPPFFVLAGALWAGVASMLSALYLRRRLGGCDRDALGMVQQIGELAFLFALASAGWPV